MVLKDENTNWIDMYNSKKYNSLIIATEMILAHKIFNNTNEMVIGIPNNIEKDVILNIVNRIKAKVVFIYADKYTVLHTSRYVYQNIIKSLETENIKVNFRVALLDDSSDSELLFNNDHCQENVA